VDLSREPEGPLRARYAVNSVMANSGEPVFDRIENPKSVYDMVLEAQEDL
jgi:hypothetical protein